MSKKKLFAFDQDDTINITKLPIDEEMAELLHQLLENYKVCIISGTNWEVMKKNDIDPIKKLGKETKFENYYIMATTGTQYWYYVGEKPVLSEGQVFEDGWKREYAHFLTEHQVNLIMSSLEKSAKKLGYWTKNPTGEIIENRGSQITYSALGQWANPEDKHAWDPDMKKRREIVALLEPELKEINVQIGIGGGTSIDITQPGIDKAYGMEQLIAQTNILKDEIFFFGDKLQPGGNDYSVKAFGIDTVEVASCEETKKILKKFLTTGAESDLKIL